MTEIDYIRDGAEIYRRSFAIIRAEADLSAIPADLEKLAVRVAHASGMVDVIPDLKFSPNAGTPGRAALAQGAAILCDGPAVAEGVTHSRLSAANRVLTHDADPAAWRANLAGGVVAFGTRADLLLTLLAELANGAPRPALILGFPVGFDGAETAKAALIANGLGLSYVTLPGTRGGSAMAAAAINSLSTERE